MLNLLIETSVTAVAISIILGFIYTRTAISIERWKDNAAMSVIAVSILSIIIPSDLLFLLPVILVWQFVILNFGTRALLRTGRPHRTMWSWEWDGQRHFVAWGAI